MSYKQYINSVVETLNKYASEKINKKLIVYGKINDMTIVLIPFVYMTCNLIAKLKLIPENVQQMLPCCIVYEDMLLQNIACDIPRETFVNNIHVYFDRTINPNRHHLCTTVKKSITIPEVVSHLAELWDVTNVTYSPEVARHESLESTDKKVKYWYSPFLRVMFEFCGRPMVADIQYTKPENTDASDVVVFKYGNTISFVYVYRHLDKDMGAKYSLSTDKHITRDFLMKVLKHNDSDGEK